MQNPANPANPATPDNPTPPWAWDEATWRGRVDQVRAGMTELPRVMAPTCALR